MIGTSPIRVLVVDDSAVVRGLMVRALSTDPEIEISGTAMHGEAALRWLKSHPVDVTILDVEMPVMDGLTTLKRIQADFPDVKVVMASSLTREGADTTVQALALGAADCVAKPEAGSVHESIQMVVSKLVPLVKVLGKRPSESANPRPMGTPIFRSKSRPMVPPKILVIGASTGGPNALTTVLTGLPVDFPLPIFIVQHMPPEFTASLATHIERDTGRPCQEAVHQGLIEKGHTYVAPGDQHMMISKFEDRMVTLLNQDAEEHFCRPSVNPLFRSAAKWYGVSVLSVMLTGMGDDGIEGTREIVKNNGTMIAQDEASSVVWGMPGAVVGENLANEVFPLADIAASIKHYCLLEVR